nr:putative reverse transcriptase domain-containing protein [Tanacetum cinerariifolium]
MILADHGEAFKQENVLAKKLHGLDQQMERKEDEILYFMDHKMYHDLRDMYWWSGMKRDIVICVRKCLTCSKELNMRQRRWIELFSNYECKIRYHPDHGEAFKQENVLAKKLHGLDQQMERKEDEILYFMDRIWVP